MPDSKKVPNTKETGSCHRARNLVSGCARPQQGQQRHQQAHTQGQATLVSPEAQLASLLRIPGHADQGPNAIKLLRHGCLDFIA